MIEHLTEGELYWITFNGLIKQKPTIGEYTEERPDKPAFYIIGSDDVTLLKDVKVLGKVKSLK